MGMTTRGAKRGLANFFWLGLVLVAIVLINLIAGRTTARLDLTQDQRFTLAEASLTTAAGLPGPVQVEVFMSSSLPPSLEQMRRDLNDLLAELRAHSDGNLVYEFVDPDADEEFRARAEALDIPSWPLEQRSESEISRRFVFAGLAFVYDDGTQERTETVPQILPGMNYEYEITRNLRAVTRAEGPARLGVLLGVGGMFDRLLDVPMDPRNPQPPEALHAQLEEQLALFFDGLYDVRLVDASAPGPLPDDIDGLFVIDPTDQVSEALQVKLDQFVMSGRPVALFLSPYRMEALSLDQPGFDDVRIPADNATGLEELLEAYGVVLHRDAIVDFQHAQVSAERQQINIGGMRGTTWIPYLDARLPEITGISETSVLVPNMNLLAFLPLDRGQPLSQASLSLTASALAAVEEERLRVDHVLRSSERSRRITDVTGQGGLASLSDAELEPYLTALEENPEAPDIDLERGPFTVALTLEGHLRSAFPERAAEEAESDHLSQTEEGRLFVVGNGHWVEALLTGQDPLLGRGAMLPPSVRGTVQQYHASNILLLRNTADWLAQDADLVRIRARGQPAFVDSGALADSEKQFYKVFNIAGVPLIFIFLGVCGFLIRQARRAAIERRYGQS